MHPVLCLGTAQIGLSYGIANRDGMPSEIEVESILETAWQNGIRILDTARAYGVAEQRIGRWLSTATQRHPLIITKLRSVESADRSAIDQEIRASLHALKTDHIHALLCHRANDLLRSEVRAALESVKDSGIVDDIGVSIYTEQEMKAAMADPLVTVLQAPISIADRRLPLASLTEAAAERGIRLFARSIYLQGALLMDPATLPSHLHDLAGPLKRFTSIARESGLSSRVLALASVSTEPGLHAVIVGADSAQQVSAAAKDAAAIVPADAISAARACFTGLPASMLDPRLWPAQ